MGKDTGAPLAYNCMHSNLVIHTWFWTEARQVHDWIASSHEMSFPSSFFSAFLQEKRPCNDEC